MTQPSGRAFSLVEVVIALAVVSFCLLSVLALLPLGLNTSRDTLQKTTAATIAAEIASDYRVSPYVNGTTTNTPRFQMSVPTATGTTNVLYFGGDDSFILNQTATGGSLYRATVIAGSTNTGYTFPLRILMTWPALADPNPAIVPPTNYTGSLEVMTAVNSLSP